MTAAKILLDKYAKTCQGGRDIDVARALGVKHSTVANWKAERAHPDAESIEKMADAIGEPLGEWLAKIEAERARSPANRKVWLRLAATFGTSLAIAAVALPSHANGRPNVQTAPGICLLCQNLWRRSKRYWQAIAWPPAIIGAV